MAKKRKLDAGLPPLDYAALQDAPKPAMGGMALGLAARARSAGPGAGRGGGRQYASAPSLAPAP